MADSPAASESGSVRSLSPVELAAFANPAATAITEELRVTLAPGIQLLRPLGAGAMGLVFLGRDPLLKRLVAIKVLSPNLAEDKVARARFVRESEASAAVMHPNVAGIYVVGELPTSRIPYYVMQFIDGRSLAEEIAGGVATSELRAKRLIGEIASALEAAHAHGLVHRDVKPANIMIETETDRPVVLDFGISAVLQREESVSDARLTHAGTYVGTPTYMSPEQAAGEPVTGKSDVYGLGLIAFELLSGHPPFDGPPVVVMAAHLEKAPPSLHTVRPGIDVHLAELVDRCLQKDPAERPTAAEVAHSLVPGTRALLEWPPPGLEALRDRGTRVVWRWAATCAVALVFFLLLHLRPTLGSPRWAEGEQSRFWSGLMTSNRSVFSDVRSDRRRAVVEAPAADATSVWIFVVGATCALLTLLAVLVVWHTAVFARDARRAVRAGYPWTVVFDVAWDRYEDTFTLLNGSGVYALLAIAKRKHLLRARRRHANASIIVVALSALAPLLWAAGLLRVRDDPSSAIITETELILIALPALLGVVALLFLDRPTRVATLTRRHVRADGSRFHGDLVASWLHVSGHVVPARSPRGRGRLVVLASAAAAAVLLCLTYIAVVVFFVGFVSTARLLSGRAAAEQWRASFRVDSTRPASFPEVDALVKRSGVPAQGLEPDLEAARLILGRAYLRDSLTPAGAVFDMDLAGARAIEATDSVHVESTPMRVVESLNDSVIPSAARLLAAKRYAQSPWLPVWRRFAASPDYPVMWRFRAGLPGVRYSLNIPIKFVTIRDLAYRNSLAGLIALSAGDVPTATLRARENISAGRHLMRSVATLDDVIGSVIVGIGRAQLSLIARATGDRTLVDEATKLRSAGIRWRGDRLSQVGWLAMVADPASRDAIHYVKQLESPALFGELIASSSQAFCLNAREVLFGTDPARAALLHEITVASGIPRAGELEQLGKRLLDDANAGTVELRPEMERSLAPLAPLGWLGVRGFRDRAQVCVLDALR